MDMVIITQTFTMARWQIVVKRSEATKQIKDQNNNKNKPPPQQQQQQQQQQQKQSNKSYPLSS